jgi:hypothetical protein
MIVLCWVDRWGVSRRLVGATIDDVRDVLRLRPGSGFLPAAIDGLVWFELTGKSGKSGK